MLRRTLLSTTAALALVALITGSVSAASPHFIGTPSLSVNGSTITVTFKAAGLGNIEEASFTLSGDVTVSSRCYTKSGNKPQAANKQETFDVDAGGTFPVSNGQTTGSISFTAPASTLECPKGQRVVIEGVSFDNLVLSGEGLSYEF
jgi:hypothetical protein